MDFSHHRHPPADADFFPRRHPPADAAMDQLDRSRRLVDDDYRRAAEHLLGEERRELRAARAQLEEERERLACDRAELDAERAAARREFDQVRVRGGKFTRTRDRRSEERIARSCVGRQVRMRGGGGSRGREIEGVRSESRARVSAGRCG